MFSPVLSDDGFSFLPEEFLSVYVGNLSLSTSVFDIEKIFRRLEELNLMELLDGVTRWLEFSLALLSMKTGLVSMMLSVRFSTSRSVACWLISYYSLIWAESPGIKRKRVEFNSNIDNRELIIICKSRTCRCCCLLISYHRSKHANGEHYVLTMPKHLPSCSLVDAIKT